MSTTKISSAQNELFRIWKSLTTSKGIKENKMFFLMGEKLIKEFLASPIVGFQALYLIHNNEIPYKTNIKKTFLSTDLFKELDVLGTKQPLLVLGFQEFGIKNLTTPPQSLEIVCPLGDPRNLGSLIRTAVGFGVKEIILTEEACHPYLPQAIKSSAGACLKVNFLKTAALVTLPIVGENFALNLKGQSLEKINWPLNLRLWVGEEGPGLKLNSTQEKNIKYVHIPTQNIESLNATVSTSIAIWEWKNKSH